VATTALDATQAALLQRIVGVLAADPATRAVALGGSFARGTATQESDIDVVLYYGADAPPDPARLAAAVGTLQPDSAPQFTAPGAWGPWVDGGAWLAFGGQRVDVLYRSLDRVQQVLTDCGQGRWELHWAQQPPYGFFSPAFVEELSIGKPLHDPHKALGHLMAKARVYPDALRREIVQAMLWNAEFTLWTFAPKHVEDGEVFGFAGCATRAVYAINQALFALALQWPVPDRLAMRTLATMAMTPPNYNARVTYALAALGGNETAMSGTLEALRECWRDVREQAGERYVSRLRP
jgi:hypothetical protein